MSWTLDKSTCNVADVQQKLNTLLLFYPKITIKAKKIKENGKIPIQPDVFFIVFNVFDKMPADKTDNELVSVFM